MAQRRELIVPSGAGLGAEVRCGDVRALDDPGIASVRQAWLDHLVVLIRDQVLSDAELVAFGRRFGELEISDPLPSPLANEGRVAQGRGDERFPEMTVVSNVVEMGVAIGGLGDGEVIWHTDMSSRAAPPNQTILYGIEVASNGGETAFLNMYAAYDALPHDLKARAGELTLKHDATTDAAGYARKKLRDRVHHDVSASPGTVHPLVRTHPETGRNCLYLGRRSRAHLAGLGIAESEALLDRIWAHATQPQFTWSHRWRQSDVLMWDNRCTMHYRTPFDVTERRTLHRVVVKGSRPFFAAGDAPRLRGGPATAPSRG
jgi:taurine dioxygenase